MSEPEHTCNQVFSRVRELIQTQLVALSTPSLAVAVARNGEVLWEEGFGWADRENRVPATEHTMYSLASISKPITATGLMTLVEKGKIDLDKPINDYLGEAKLKAWVGDAKDATVRRVANHSSGLPLHYQFFYEDEPYSRPPMDETIRRYGNLVTAPGELYQYSNLGYGVIDYVMSRVSGLSYADFMRQEVFLPLGMTHASIHIGPRLGAYQAVRYGTDGLPIPFYDFDHPGASAVYCSAHDLARFGMFHLKAQLADQKAILSDASIDEMHRPTMPTRRGELDRGYGVGWAVRDDYGTRVLQHDGSMGGVKTELHLVPEERLAIVVLCNADSHLRRLTVDELLYGLVPKCEAHRAEIDAKKEAEMAAFERPFPPFQPPAELLGEWKGSVHTYQKDLPITVEFKESGDVHVHLGEQPVTLMSATVMRNGLLTGEFVGDLETVDARRGGPYVLRAGLRLRGHALNGPLTAVSNKNGPRMRNALTHWMEVRKQV